LTKFERETSFVLHLAGRLGLGITRNDISDPNTSDSETGLDAIMRLPDGLRVGVQVTEIDPFPNPGKARALEKKVAGQNTNAVYCDWAQNDLQIVLDSLKRAIQRKIAIAEPHPFEQVDTVWLLACAGIPEHGAVASTFLMTPWLSAIDMNRATDDDLQQSKYDRCFLLPILGAEQVQYTWTKHVGWKKSVRQPDIREYPREAYVTSLIRAAAIDDWQEVDRLCDEECKKVLSEMRGS